MMVIQKKQVIMVALVAMVGIAGYLNWRYESTEPMPYEPVSVSEDEPIGEARMVDGTASEGGYFDSCRLNRESARAKALEILTATVDNANSSAEAKANAQKQIAEIAKNVESEGNIENLLRARGFTDSVVFISDGNVTVTVKTQGLTSPETARIKDAVSEFIGQKEIKIVEVKD